MTFKPGQCGGSQHDLDGGTLRLNHAVADIKNDKWLCTKQIRIAENVKLPVSLPWTAFTPMVLRVDVRIFILLLRPMDTGEILCSTPVTEVGDFGLISCLSCPAPSWCSLHPQVEEGHFSSTKLHAMSPLAGSITLHTAVVLFTTCNQKILISEIRSVWSLKTSDLVPSAALVEEGEWPSEDLAAVVPACTVLLWWRRRKCAYQLSP